MTGKTSLLKTEGSSNANAAKIAVLYFLLSSIWIVASDIDILSYFSGINISTFTRWQTGKGLLFVIVTAVALYGLLWKFLKLMDISTQALARSEHRLRLAMDNNPSTFVIYDKQLRFEFVNNMAIQVAARGREEMLGRRDDELFSPDTTAEYLPLLQLAQETRIAQSAECRIVLPGGATAFAVVTYVPVLDEQGEIVQIIGATHNITERKRGEERLRRSEEQFTRLADNLPGMVYVCLNDDDFTVLYMSRGAQRILGYSVYDFKNADVAFARRIHPDDEQPIKDAIHTALKNNASFHIIYRFKHKSGQWVWLDEHGSGNYKNGQLESRQGFIRDITSERTTQRNRTILAQLGHELAAANSMEKLGEAIITAVSSLWTWDSLSLYVRQSGKGRFRTVVEADTFNGEKQYSWDLRSDAKLDVGQTLTDPLLIHRSAEETGSPANHFGNEARASASLMYAALRINDKKVGVLSVKSYTLDVFDEDDLMMLQQIADIAAPAMARSKAEERNRSFSSLGEQLSGTVAPQDAAIIIASVADDMIGWDCCTLHLYYPGEDRVDQLIAYDELNGVRTSLGAQLEIKPTGLVKRALTEGQMLILRDPSEMDPGDVRRFGDTNRLSASLMWVPVRSSSGTSGVFSIQSYTFQAYDDDDLQLFQALADHCSSTLERARAQQSLRSQEQQYRQAISSAGAVPYQLDFISNKYVFVGDGIEAITGWSATEFTLEIWNDIVLETIAQGSTNDKDVQMISQEMREGKRASWKADIHLRTRSGEERWVADSSVIVVDQNGRSIGCLGILQDITERKEIEEKLLHSSLHDPLTGLANRVLLIDHIQQALHRSKRRNPYHFAIIFLDIDRFKNINDSLGHLVGDMLLISVARLLEQCIRLGDTVARFAGDEFVLLLDDISHPDDAITIAEKVLQRISEPLMLSGHEVSVSASLGIALDSTEYTDPESILRDADNALYRAKARGKACYEIFDKRMHRHALTALETENDLRGALQRNELRLHYQPIIEMQSGRISGFEALVRWQHPTRGLIPPNDFIPMAEETRLIIPIGYWVMQEAGRQIQTWNEKFSLTCPAMTMSVNLSVRQFSVPDLDQRLLSLVSELGLDPRCLRLEITESILMEKHDTIIDSLNSLKQAGFSLSLDDFGTGYSSLSYLHQFPIDIIKIDRSFINRIELAGSEREIVRSIIHLAGNLGMGVIAEGVETNQQLSILKELGCDQVQGYFLSKPVPAEIITQLLTTKPHWEV